MSTSTLISFSSLFFCSDVTYFGEPQAFSKKGRILIQSSLQVESLDVLYLTNRFHMLPCIYYWTDARLHGIYLFYTWKHSLFLSNFAISDTKIALWGNELSAQNEANWLVAMLSKELWLVQRITQLWNLNRAVSSLTGLNNVCACASCHDNSDQIAARRWYVVLSSCWT